jgi:type IV secretory pathway ATPase VirB11/archaellum biosynthesis ATPase
LPWVAGSFSFGLTSKGAPQHLAVSLARQMSEMPLPPGASFGGPDMDLRGYEQSKFTLAEILRSTGTSFPDDQANREEELHGLFARLAEDRFNLVVVGRFSRGKTSVMNATPGD